MEATARTASDEEKEKHNATYKVFTFEDALHHYDKALEADKSNIAVLTNKADESLRKLTEASVAATDVYIEEPEAIKEKSTDIQKTSPGTPSLVENSESEDEDTDDVQVVDDDQIDPPSISSSHSSEEIVVVPDTAADRRESNDEVVATEELRNRRYVKPTKLRTTRNSNKNMNDGLYMANVALSSPLRYNDAMASPEADDWFYAMAEEYSNFKANDTWVMVDLPPGKLHSRPAGVLTVMAAVRGWNVRTIDVKAAFLHATLNEEVYMSQLKGFEDGSSKVCKLLKSVYGLRQSPRAWYLTLKDWFEKRGYKFTPHEPCLYAKITPNDMIFVEIHVDDFKITSNKEDAITNLEYELEKTFKIKKCGNLKRYLGIDFERDWNTNTIYISQSVYINAMLVKFGFDKANPVSLPMQPGVKFDNEDPFADKTEYLEKIGGLLFLARVSRPDIMTAVSMMAQNSKEPKKGHMTVVNNIFRYLKGTIGYRLALGGKRISGDHELLAYTDSNWGGEAGRSRTGFVILLDGCPIVWSSKKQGVIAMSTAEAEYVALAATIKEVNWMESLLKTLTIPHNKCVKVMVDKELLALSQKTSS
ncbi:DNA-directed DNA polymerase [Synchytrium endobioticum]|uniref:DNA-directed DNA polymerase n=1 Tax=Synchytrium endobioticum TaxID=286115 RepID=A0A507DN37_9FUNG|nr:DNA-directed DNA polymerase [Synchytrium endobioticum]